MTTTIEPPVSAKAQPIWDLTLGERMAFAATVLAGIAPIPWLIEHAQQLSRRPHYDLFPFILPLAIALGWNLLRKPVPAGPHTGRNPKRTSLIAAFALMLLVVGVAFHSPWLAAVATIVNALAIIDAIGGGLLVWRLLPTWGFLWLAIPLPQSIDLKMLTGLQRFVTYWSSGVLDRIGVVHVVEGNVIEVASRRLFVEQACSGISSLFTLILGTLFIAAWYRFRPVRTLVLLASSVVWVLAGNVVRIVVIAYADSRWNFDLSHGWKHTFLGIILFLGMLAMVFSTDRLVGTTLNFLGQEVAWILALPFKRWTWLSRKTPAKSNADSAALVQAEPITLRAGLHGLGATWLVSWPIGVLYAFLLAAQISFTFINKRDILQSDKSIPAAFASLHEQDLPTRIGPFQRREFRTEHREMVEQWGEFSREWSYSAGPSVQLVVSLDYTFVGWHELTGCYEGIGCTIPPENQRVVDGHVEATFDGPKGGHRFLVYGLADSNSRPLKPPGSQDVFDLVFDRLSDWAPSEHGLGLQSSLPTFQYQVVVSSETPLTDELKAAARDLFEKSRATFLEHGPKGERTGS